MSDIFKIFLMNITLVPLMVIWTIVSVVFAPFAFIFFKLFAGLKTEIIIRKFVWYYGRGWQWIISPFVKIKLEGFQDDDFPRPSILIVNHLSFFDTFFMNQLPFSDVCFAVRAWPFRILFYRPFMRLGKYLNVESLSWEQISEKAQEVLSKKGVILFFPEGHRSRDGKLKKFYSGAFKLSAQFNIPMVPICITGTDKFFPPGRKWFEPAEVKMRTLGIFYPEEYRSRFPHLKMKKHIHDLISRHIQQPERTYQKSGKIHKRLADEPI